MQKKRFFSYLVLTLMIGVFAFAFVVGQTVSAADGPVSAYPTYNEGGGCMDVNNDSDPVLYDQITAYTSSNGAPDQKFEAAFDAYSAEGADDFVVDGMGWHISGVDLCGTFSTTGPMNSVSVWIYADAAGVPAASPTCTYADLIPTTGVSSASMEVDFPTDCSVTPGTYWVAAQVDQTFGTGGQHFWSNSADVIGAESHWRNPGDGFGTGCTDWSPSGTTCAVGGDNTSFMFAVEGTLAAPTDVNLTSFDGGSNSSVIAALIVGIFSLGVAALVTIRYRMSQDQVA